MKRSSGSWLSRFSWGVSLTAALAVPFIGGWPGMICNLGPATVAAEEHTKDSLATVKENLTKKKAVLLDVREANEWTAGHLAAATNKPLSQLSDEKSLAALVKELNKDQIIYCHCKAGRRALTAAEILKKQGFDVRPLKQGYDQLLEAGFEKAK